MGGPFHEDATTSHIHLRKKTKRKILERNIKLYQHNYHHFETKIKTAIRIEEFRDKNLRVQRETKVIIHEKKYTNLLPSECNPRDQNDISSQNASKREQKKPDFVKRD